MVDLVALSTFALDNRRPFRYLLLNMGHGLSSMEVWIYELPCRLPQCLVSLRCSFSFSMAAASGSVSVAAIDTNIIVMSRATRLAISFWAAYIETAWLSYCLLYIADERMCSSSTLVAADGWLPCDSAFSQSSWPPHVLLRPEVQPHILRIECFSAFW